MLILSDQATPAPLRASLRGHLVKTASQQAWDRLSNGELLRPAEQAGFDLLVTTDKNLRYRQNLSGRKMAILVLGEQQWPALRLHVQLVIDAVNAVKPGSYRELTIPL